MNKERDPVLIGVGVLTALVPSALLFMAVTYLFVFTLIAGIVAVVLGVGGVTKTKRVVGVSLCVLSVAGSFALIAYAGSSGHPIKLVIPNDYTGRVTIHLDEERGSSPTRTDEYWVYEIGDDGSLLTNNVRPFSRWHKLRAEFRDGRVILDYASDRFEGHGYVLEGGGTSYQGGDPDPTHYWELNEIAAERD